MIEPSLGIDAGRHGASHFRAERGTERLQARQWQR
jgi:hypothetical protein